MAEVFKFPAAIVCPEAEWREFADRLVAELVSKGISEANAQPLAQICIASHREFRDEFDRQLRAALKPYNEPATDIEVSLRKLVHCCWQAAIDAHGRTSLAIVIKRNAAQ